MKHLKMLGLFAMAAAALMAFAGSASAQTLTAPTGTLYTGEIITSLEGSALLKAGFAEITCTSGTFSSKITTNNSTEASGSITAVNFSSCKEGQTVDTLNNNGTLTILKSNHVVTGTGVEVTTAVAGVSCVYGFGTGTTLGQWTNSLASTAGTVEDRVTIDTSAKLPKISGGFLCASPATWTATEVITSPADSYVD
jgi:hypothetical protein